MKKAYKISLHESYRANGKVKKKQYCIGTAGYYDVMNYGLYDCCSGKIRSVADQLNRSEDCIYDLINEKYEPLQERTVKEFEQSEGYRTEKNTYRDNSKIHKG